MNQHESTPDTDVTVNSEVQLRHPQLLGGSSFNELKIGAAVDGIVSAKAEHSRYALPTDRDTRERRLMETDLTIQAALEQDALRPEGKLKRVRAIDTEEILAQLQAEGHGHYGYSPHDQKFFVNQQDTSALEAINQLAERLKAEAREGRPGNDL